MEHRHFGYKAKLDPVCLRCAFPVVSGFVAEIARRATDRQTGGRLQALVRTAGGCVFRTSDGGRDKRTTCTDAVEQGNN